MRPDIIPDDVLDALRLVGDPDPPPGRGDTFRLIQKLGFVKASAGAADDGDPRLPGDRAGGREHGTGGNSRAGGDGHPGEPDLRQVEAAIQQVRPDRERVRHATHLFAQYGTEICGALLMAALPQAYAARWPSRVLVSTARLQDDFRRRIVRTAQFLLVVMREPMEGETFEDLWPDCVERVVENPATDAEAMRPWEACVAIRRFHEATRKQVLVAPGQPALGEGNRTPLNQEDLLGTLLTFTITVFEVLERFGIAWSADDQDAYLHVWDLVGAHLGIGSQPALEKLAAYDQYFVERTRLQGWVGLRPPTTARTRQLLAQLRERQWPRPGLAASGMPAAVEGRGGDDCRAGRLLLRALLNELTAAMPSKSRPLPLSVMRHLASARVRERLNLGGGGIVLSMLDLLPKRSVRVDPFTAVPVVNPISATVLHSLANEVTRRTMVRFLRTEAIFLPGLKEWSQSLVDPMEVGIA